jgi:hypothetical protein
MDYITPEQTYAALCDQNKNAEFREACNNQPFEPLKYIVDELDEFMDGNNINACLPDEERIKKQFSDNINFRDITANCTILWYQRGTNEQESWYIIGHMTDLDIYFLLDGSCCYTGFEASGNVKFQLSRTLQVLCTFGLTDHIRSSTCPRPVDR